ncbi:MAG: YihY/virulence factor BrkB family protein [Trueperaceae bacterium]
MRGTIQAALKRYSDANGPLLAAALAYFSVFSLAPFLVIVIALFVFFGAGDAQGTVLDIVARVVGEDGAAIVRTMIEGQARQGGGAFATVTSVAILLFAATTLFFQLKRALDILWGTVPEVAPGLGSAKALLRGRARALGLVLAIGLLLLLALFLATVVSTAIAAAGDVLPGGPAPWRLLNRLVAFGALVVVFGLTFRLLPNAAASWGAIAIGSSVTAALIVLFSWLFGIYVANVAVAGAYGAAGSLVVLLLWVFFSAQVVLLGASLTRTLAWDDA